MSSCTLLPSLLLLLALASCALAVTPREVLDEEWEAFKLQHGKNYPNQVEELFRKKIYSDNKLKIAKHNQRFLQGLHKFNMAMNQFGDLLNHEFVASMNGLQRNQGQRRYNGSAYLRPHNLAPLPDEVDWRAKGYVTPIKDQGKCGACWSFSTTGALEGQHKRQTGKLVSLSEQNLVDCSSDYGNKGCDGGQMDQAFEYIQDNKGIDTEKSYPYKAVQGTCHYTVKNKGATDTGFVDVPSGDEEALQEAVATMGPVSVGIDASHESFQFYSEGVYDEPDCSPEDIDHAVLVVGYGTYQDTDFWLIKNSWNTNWGIDGFARMSRNKDNQCGIASMASYPLV